MADLIRIKGGSGDVPTLQDRELAYSKDENALYIGTENGNVKLLGDVNTAELNSIKADIATIKADIASINARLDALSE